MDDLSLLLDLHLDGARQGPGCAADTRLAVEMSGLLGQKGLKIAAIGCGTGASTLVLAELLDANLSAVDFLPEFLAVLDKSAEAAGLGARIKTLATSMEELPFEDASLDAIWSEGAIYNIGFDAGIRAWRRFLKPGGILAVSELTWLTATRPEALQSHWDAEYPEAATAGAKIAQLEAAGCSPLGYFPLSPSSWLDNYYRPMQARFAPFLERHAYSDAAKAIVAAEEAEIALYERNKDFVSYGYYIARKLPD